MPQILGPKNPGTSMCCGSGGRVVLGLGYNPWKHVLLSNWQPPLNHDALSSRTGATAWANSLEHLFGHPVAEWLLNPIQSLVNPTQWGESAAIPSTKTGRIDNHPHLRGPVESSSTNQQPETTCCFGLFPGQRTLRTPRQCHLLVPKRKESVLPRPPTENDTF